MAHTAKHYRRRAAELRRLAALVSDPALSDQLKLVAQDYDELAEEPERSREPPLAET